MLMKPSSYLVDVDCMSIPFLALLIQVLCLYEILMCLSYWLLKQQEDKIYQNTTIWKNKAELSPIKFKNPADFAIILANLICEFMCYFDVYFK